MVTGSGQVWSGGNVDGFFCITPRNGTLGFNYASPLFTIDIMEVPRFATGQF
jgi:hypothetical protein